MMGIVSIEIFSIVVLLVLFIDHIIKYRNKQRIYSFFYYITVISVMLLAVVDIYFSLVTKESLFYYMFFFIGYIILAIPSIGIFLYTKTVLFNDGRNLKRNILLMSVYFNIYVFFGMYDLAINYNNPINTIFLTDDYHLTILSLIPLFLTVFELIYRLFKKKERVNTYFIILLCFPIIATILDVKLLQLTFIVPSYVLSILLIYLYRSTNDLNFDHLTGLYNRRLLEQGYFNKYLNSSKSIAVYLIDVDKFKDINDNYGHAYGDKILKDFSDIVRKSIRSSDYPIRLGGDEFLLIVFLKDNKYLKLIPNKINRNINEYNKKEKINLSVSIGFDIYDGKENFNSFIDNIDELMYESKKAKKRSERENARNKKTN